jgi:hypothetical protein
MRFCWLARQTLPHEALTFTFRAEVIPHALWDLLSKLLKWEENGQCRACDVTVANHLEGANAQRRNFFTFVTTKKRWAMGMPCAWMSLSPRDIHVEVGAKFAVILPPLAWK